MLAELLARFQQGHRTIPYPRSEPVLPDRFRGLPVINQQQCVASCSECIKACPLDAISRNGALKIDLGRCVFCNDCVQACEPGALSFSTNYRLAARSREELLSDGSIQERGLALEKKIRGLFGRSLKLRQVSAAGCNGCEVDVNVLSTVVFDISRFGISFVASPRHADGILVTGPVSENMKTALLKTWEAVPAPKIVIATGACAISGGPFRDHPQVHNGVDGIIPVDLYIPGCPPHPMTTLEGLLGLMGRLEARK